MMKNNYTQKQTSLPLETIDETKLYAFSLSPDPRSIEHKSVKTLIQGFRTFFHNLVDRKVVDTVFDYQMYPEFSSSGKFHLHGFIRINDPLDFYFEILHKQLSGYFAQRKQYIFELDRIGNGETENSLNDKMIWYTYSTKQQNWFKRKLESKNDQVVIKNKTLFRPRPTTLIKFLIDHPKINKFLYITKDELEEYHKKYTNIE